MSFRFTQEQEAFRQEMRRFIAQELGPDWEGDVYSVESELPDRERHFLEKLSERGWIAPGWPKEYGGAGLSVMEQFIFNQEMGYYRAPRSRGVGASLVGPMLILHGTPEQKAQHLPGIARGETVWCQGFSEHNAGSDLASLQCRAVLDGDEYVVNGTKMWTSFSHFADWMIPLVRTDPQGTKTPRH
jgi:alkylation response protein AidB-like acyl-CoA dehydrogenase